MTDDFGMTSTEDEVFDFSGDGIVKGEHEWVISSMEQDVKDNGMQHKLTFESKEVSFPISVGHWITHTNPKASAAGRGQLKRIAIAALGQPRYTAATIKGARVLATIGEDKDGFARLSGFKPVPQAIKAVAL